MWLVNTDCNKPALLCSTNTVYLHNVSSSTTGHPTDQLGHWKPSSPFLRYVQKIPVRPCVACQNHRSSKVICSKVHYHHHLWWWIPYDGGRPAAASTHNDILLLLAVTPSQMAHAQQPVCQTEHIHNTWLGLTARNEGSTGMALKKQTSFVRRPQCLI